MCDWLHVGSVNWDIWIIINEKKMCRVKKSYMLARDSNQRELQLKDSLIYYLKRKWEWHFLVMGGCVCFAVAMPHSPRSHRLCLHTHHSPKQLGLARDVIFDSGLPVWHIPPALRTRRSQFPQASYLLALMCVSWRAAWAAGRERSGRKPCLTWPSHVEGESK